MWDVKPVKPKEEPQPIKEQIKEEKPKEEKPKKKRKDHYFYDMWWR
jgi:hypothetical protein